jgi:hypothetical protein
MTFNNSRMKKVTSALLLVAFIAACGQNTRKGENNAANTFAVADPNVVYVYYFHGPQRCKTCVAVGDIAQKTIESVYADNSEVRFIEIDTGEASAKAWVEKYEVTWNALIIAKGEDYIEITRQAFATAVSNPQSLDNLIRDEVNKRL